jgi:hypothetical protein
MSLEGDLRKAFNWDCENRFKWKNLDPNNPAHAIERQACRNEAVADWSKTKCIDHMAHAILLEYQREINSQGLDEKSDDPLIKACVHEIWCQVCHSFGKPSEKRVPVDQNRFLSSSASGGYPGLPEKRPRPTEDAFSSSSSFGAGGAPGLPEKRPRPTEDAFSSSSSFGAGGAPGLAEKRPRPTEDEFSSSSSFGAGGAPGLAEQRASTAPSKYRWVADRHAETALTIINEDEKNWIYVYSPRYNSFGIAVGRRDNGSIVVIVWDKGLLVWADLEHFADVRHEYLEHKKFFEDSKKYPFKIAEINRKEKYVLDMARVWVQEHRLIKGNPELEKDPAYVDGYKFKYDEDAPEEQ